MYKFSEMVFYGFMVKVLHMPRALLKSRFPDTWSLQLRLIGLIVFAGLVFIPSRPSLARVFFETAIPSKGLTSKSFVAKAVALSGKAVVTIETQRRVRSRGSTGLPPGFFVDPYLNRFFERNGLGVPRSRVETSQGSGVIFDSKGLVLTNAHVVANIDRLTVGLPDGRRVSGRVLGQDSLTDLAVVRLDGSGQWPVAPLGDSDKLEVGDWAIAVGNPYGLENTVTLGIVSNLSRNVAQLGISGKRLDFIQTDAAINPGNSGGPLLNAAGEVIGINTLVRTGPGAGLGFAIPINRARDIANQLVERGRASHPVVGISLSPVPSVGGTRKNLTGAVVRFVVPGGPAARGGIQVQDIILTVGGRSIKGPSDVVSAINQHEVGKPLDFVLKRGTRKVDLIIYPVEMEQMRRVKN